MPLINDTLCRTRDLSQQIYLTGVLNEIPVASAAEVLLSRLKAGQPMEEIELDALTRIGHPAAPGRIPAAPVRAERGAEARVTGVAPVLAT